MHFPPPPIEANNFGNMPIPFFTFVNTEPINYLKGIFLIIVNPFLLNYASSLIPVNPDIAKANV
jgi:hypothetical protein